MKYIGILSDTHGFLDPQLIKCFSDCDEIWHAGDFGEDVAGPLQSMKPLKGVYGNIDGTSVRNQFPGELIFTSEGTKVFMIHIGGYPGHYEKGIREQLLLHQPDLYICGHSHLLKIMRDAAINNLLHINPGAAGRIGFHLVRTAVRLKIAGKKIYDVEVIELGKRSSA